MQALESSTLREPLLSKEERVAERRKWWREIGDGEAIPIDPHVLKYRMANNRSGKGQEAKPVIEVLMMKD